MKLWKLLKIFYRDLRNLNLWFFCCQTPSDFDMDHTHWNYRHEKKNFFHSTQLNYSFNLDYVLFAEMISKEMRQRYKSLCKQFAWNKIITRYIKHLFLSQGERAPKIVEIIVSKINFLILALYFNWNCFSSI